MRRMSDMDTGDDEVDYGDEELGDRDAALTSFQAAADDDMVQDAAYEDLYDDVNVGYFEAPAERIADGGKGLEDEARVSGACADGQRADHCAGLNESLSVKISEAPTKQGEVKGTKKEPRDNAETPGTWSRGHKCYAGLFKEGVSTSEEERGKGSRTSRPEEQGDVYSNGPGQRIIANQNKESRATGALPPSGNGEIALGSGEMVMRVCTSGGLSVGQGALDGGRGSSACLSKASQAATLREPSPNLANDYTPKHAGQQSFSGNGGTMLFIGDLHWWTTDAELEAALSEYGRVKNLKFFEERVSGKSKGFCQVEFHEYVAASACKQGMNGRKFHDRPCIVAFGNTRSIQQMGFAQERKAQAQSQAQQGHITSRRTPNDNLGVRGGSSHMEREGGRGYARIGTSSRPGYGQSTGNKGGTTGPTRGRGNYMGKGGGSSGGVGVSYSKGHSGLIGGHQTGMMMHQGIMGQGYDPGYGPPMGRGGAAYGGYVMPGPPFSGMVQPFPSLGPGGLPGVSPHVNPAFFGRSAPANGMGMMPGGMEGPHQGMWAEVTMSGWVGEEHDRRARDESYGEDGASMDYGYSIEMGHEKGRTGGGQDKDNEYWLERWRRDDRDADWEQEHYWDRDRDGYRDQRDKEREREKDNDWERDRLPRMRNNQTTEEEEEQRLRSRGEDYGKRCRMVVER